MCFLTQSLQQQRAREDEEDAAGSSSRVSVDIYSQSPVFKLCLRPSFHEAAASVVFKRSVRGSAQVELVFDKLLKRSACRLPDFGCVE